MKCACETFYPRGYMTQSPFKNQVSSPEWQMVLNLITPFFGIWGTVFLLLTIDLIQKRFNDSSIANRLVSYRDANGNKMKFHVFISHAQTSGGHQTRLLYSELEKRGIVVWYDQSKDLDITPSGMVKGVTDSAVFLLFLSGKTKPLNTSPLRRPYCQLEIESARIKKKKIVVVYEKLDNTHSFDWNWDTTNVDGTKNLTEVGGLQYPHGEHFDETTFQTFVNSISEGRAIMYDRDLGKIDGMMNDLINQISKQMKD